MLNKNAHRARNTDVLKMTKGTKELNAFYTQDKKIVLSKSIPGFTGRNIRPCKEPKENASAQQMGMAIRSGNNTQS